MVWKVTTHSQGTDTWKEVTKNMTISAYNPLANPKKDLTKEEFERILKTSKP
jgi:hypothetical protein